MTNTNKLWDKGYEADKAVERFTVGMDSELDLQLARADVEGSAAHARMLAGIGLLTDNECASLLTALDRIGEEIDRGEFAIEPGVEDVHSQVELLLTRRLGDTGKKIHSGRSRNDQVLVDLKLFFRARIKEIAIDVRKLFDRLSDLSEEHKQVLMPGYTHLQVATPSSFGLWFGAYAESLADDLLMLDAAYHLADQNPLGSAAGYGSSFPLDRDATTRLLGFGQMHYNSINAQFSRGKTERSLSYAMAGIASTVGRLAMDICLWCGPNYGFVSFPDELTTGSSIMPHKKNPDVCELIRGRCNLLQGLPNDVSLLCTNLPTGYHRDYQLLKEVIFPAIGQLKECLRMMEFMLANIRVNTQILDNPIYDYLFTVEDVNRLVLDGVPFRDAYRTVGEQVQSGTYRPHRTVEHTHQGSIGNLCTEQIRQKMERNIREILSDKE